MSGSTPPLGLRLMLLVLLAAFIGAASQEQPKLEKKKAEDPKLKDSKRNAPAKEAPKKKAAPAKAEKQPVLVKAVANMWTDENFEQWIFGQDRTAANARQRMEQLVALHLEALDRECQLTDEQKKKFRLAARGDIKRFYDAYETVKRKFHAIRKDQEKVNDIWQDIQPLSMTWQAGFFYDDSLFYKSLQNTLMPQQFARYDAIAQQRREFLHQANIELAVTMFDLGIPLRDGQRRELTKLLMSTTKPPRKTTPFGYAGYYLLIYQLGRLPEEKVKRIFDDRQWSVVSQLTNRFRGMEHWLKQSGMLDDEDEADRVNTQPLRKK